MPNKKTKLHNKHICNLCGKRYLCPHPKVVCAKRKDKLMVCLMCNPITFYIQDKELANFLKWQTKHSKKCNKYDGAIGGSISYTFTPTGIGVGISVSCSMCKEDINITDYDIW